MILLVVPPLCTLNQVLRCFHECTHLAAYLSLGAAKHSSDETPSSLMSPFLGWGWVPHWSGPLLSTQQDWSPGGQGLLTPLSDQP